MNLKYVTDLEHSRKLVAAGWMKETETWWYLYPDKILLWTADEVIRWMRGAKIENVIIGKKFFPAPLTDELLEELPEGVRIQKAILSKEYFIWIPDEVGSVEKRSFNKDKSLPNALADLWCRWMKGE